MTKTPERIGGIGPFFGKLDLTTFSYGSRDDYSLKLVRRLKGLGLHRNSLLYVGVSNVDPQLIRQFGASHQDQRSIFAYDEEKLLDPLNDDTIWDYVFSGEDNPMVLVYDGSRLEQTDEGSDHYAFKKGTSSKEALVAAFELKI